MVSKEHALLYISLVGRIAQANETGFRRGADLGLSTIQGTLEGNQGGYQYV